MSISITNENCNGFESRQSFPSGSALKLSGAKRTILLVVCQSPETGFNLQEMVSLTKIKEIVDCTFTGDLKMLDLVTRIGTHASTLPCAYCITASKPWDSDSPLRTLNLKVDKWQKTPGKEINRRKLIF